MKIYIHKQKAHKGINYLLKALLITVLTFCFQPGYSQDTAKERMVYKLKPSVDIPLVASCAAWCGYAAHYTYNKVASTPEQILALTPASINPLDRWAIRPYNHTMDRFSYYQFYASFPLPVVFFSMR